MPSAPAIAAESADPGITVKVGAGPFLVGQTIPAEVTVTNHGTAAATGVKAYTSRVSGSYLGFSLFGPLDGGASIPAGEKLVVNVEGRVYKWEGVPVVRFAIYSSGSDSSWENNNFEVTVPVTAPDSAKGSVSGLIYGDANGNRVADAGEGLADVRVELSDSSPTKRIVRTGADGRFTFSDVPVRNYAVFTNEAPDGWVLPRSEFVDVDGDGDEYLEYRAVRPFSDQLAASIKFTEDSYAVGQTAQIQVTLTNKGTADITGIKAGCDRSGGEGPHVVDMQMGDFAWNAPGVTLAAGQTRTFVITGVVPAKSAGFASVSVECDFGSGDDPTGHPAASDLARVPGAAPKDMWGLVFHDRNEDRNAGADELLAGVKIGVVDGATGVVVAKAYSDAEGRADFKNLPAGPYRVKVYGPWKLRDSNVGFYVGTCGMYCGDSWVARVVPGPDVPDTDPDPAAIVPPVSTGGGTSTAGGLASTGASTVGLTAFGLLTLVAGFAGVVAGRRRRLV